MSLAKAEEAAKSTASLGPPYVYANADTAEEAARCFDRGATGISVARTEHMLRAPGDLDVLRDALFGASGCKQAALRLIRAKSRASAYELLTVSNGRWTSIRLLDPPFHEFGLAGVDSSMAEANPMMGVRGTRNGVLHSDIYEAQVEGILDALASSRASSRLGILYPFVNWATELQAAGGYDQLSKFAEVSIGSMVETPEAIFNAPRLASSCDYLSVGTNDLVQFCLGMSRDDVSDILMPAYLDRRIVDHDVLDDFSASSAPLGLLRILSDGIPSSVPWGVCGEHGGDPKAIEMFQAMGARYVGASPSRVVASVLAVARIRAVRELGVLSDV